MATCTRRHRGLADLGPDAEPGGADGRAQLRDDPAVEGAVAEQMIGLVGADRGEDVSFDQHPRNVSHEEDPLRLEADGEGGRGFVGVDIERPFRQGSDDRDPTPPERVHHGGGATRNGIADEAELGNRCCLEAGGVADQADGAWPDGRAQRTR